MRSTLNLNASENANWSRCEWMPNLSLFAGLPENYGSLAVQWLLVGCVLLLAASQPVGRVLFFMVVVMWLSKQFLHVRKLRAKEHGRVANRLEENQKLVATREQFTNDG